MSNLNNINLEENLYEDYKGPLKKNTSAALIKLVSRGLKKLIPK